MYKTGIALSFGLLMAVGNASAAPLQSFSTPKEMTSLEQFLKLIGPQELKAACCKTCRKGKACGNSCISRDKSCRKGVGCACNG